MARKYGGSHILRVPANFTVCTLTHTLLIPTLSVAFPFLCFREVELPEKTADVGNSTFPKVPPPTSTINLTDKHVRRSSVGGAANIGLFIPPDMSKVYYKESYEEFVRLKEPMEPKSLCWTPKQELYVGCAGGQLMMVDFDSGSATVLVNPQPHSEVLPTKTVGSRCFLWKGFFLHCLFPLPLSIFLPSPYSLHPFSHPPVIPYSTPSHWEVWLT